MSGTYNKLSEGVTSRRWGSTTLCGHGRPTSINRYYNPSSGWTQCRVMTQIGQRINGFALDTSACPSIQVIAKNPALAVTLADPYSQAAEFVLDNPAWGVDRDYLKSGGVNDALTMVGNCGDIVGPDMSLDRITAEVAAGRPVVAAITWLDTKQSHIVAIGGFDGEELLIEDPANGESVIKFGDFPRSYLAGAELDEYVLTHP
jgi:hypothetical protein